MVGMGGAGMAKHFSPKDLELKARLRDCLRTVMGLSFGLSLNSLKLNFSGLFSNNLD